MSKEWQEASNERAKEQKMNPISGKLYLMYFSNPYTELRFFTGITSEGYSGKGFVTRD